MGNNTKRGLRAEDIDRIGEEVSTAVASLGLEPLEIEFRSGSLRIALDSDPTPDLETITSASRLIAERLEAGIDDLIPALSSGYELEVSSPGLERLLKRPEHFKRYVGSKVALTVRSGAKTMKLKGKLVEAGTVEIAVLLEGTKDLERFSYGEVEVARTVFVWPTAKAQPDQVADVVLDELGEFEDLDEAYFEDQFDN